MPCLYCHEPCGDQSFCGPECYDECEKARDEYLAQSELGFRLSYDDLAEIMEVLMGKFTGENKTDHPQVTEMRRRAGSAAWHNVLTLAGWTEQEFEEANYQRFRG